VKSSPYVSTIDDAALQVRSMGPFSTILNDFAEFGSSARATAKDNRGDPEFWFFAVVSGLYFSGIIHEVHYICPFPGHNPAATGGVRILFDEVMSRFAKCFRKQRSPTD
jgi:hypothetical protein